MDNEYLETFKEDPLVSIYYHNGFKLSDDEGGLGVAVPYSYFPSEINKRIPLNENISFDEIEDFSLIWVKKKKKNFKKYMAMKKIPKKVYKNLSFIKLHDN